MGANCSQSDPRREVEVKSGINEESVQTPMTEEYVDLSAPRVPFQKLVSIGSDSLLDEMEARKEFGESNCTTMSRLPVEAGELPSRTCSTSTPQSLLDTEEEPTADVVYAAAPVVFLDVDGVLNNDGDPPRDTRPLNVYCMKQFGRLMRSCPEAEIVLSSTWRLDRRLVTKLLTALEKEAGVDIARCVDQTPHYRPRRIVTTEGHHRPQEITAWLRKHPEVKRWVVLDDLKLKVENAIWIDPGTGLTEKNIDEAIMMIGGGSVMSV